METFGEKLRYERENRGLSIREVADILPLDEDRLLALERNDFEILPDNDVMTECLRRYAECMDVEADLMIADYLRERQICLSKLGATLSSRTPSLPREATSSHPNRRLLAWPAVSAIVAILALLGLGAWWVLAGNRGAAFTTLPEPDLPAEVSPSAPSSADSSGPSIHAGEEGATISIRPPTPTESVKEIKAPASELPAERSTPATSAPVVLSVPDHGVGTGVSNRQLVGRGERFREGAQVWFWTNLVGGSPGDRVDHVWLHEGEEMIRISLRVGGPRWRTYSAKVLTVPGAWAVEARDDDGRVLARDEFYCTP